MLRFLKSLLVIVSLYFVLHTAIVFGLLDGRYQVAVSSIKEIVWISCIAWYAIRYRSVTKQYISQMRKPSLVLISMAILGLIVTWFNNPNLSLFVKNSVIGLKYGRYFMFIFLSAGLLGYIKKDATKTKEVKKVEEVVGNWIRFVVKLCWWVLI